MIINALSISPGEYPVRCTLCTSSSVLKSELETDSYEIIYPFPKDKRIAIIRDEHAAIFGKAFNRVLYSTDNEKSPKCVIQGRFFIVGVDEDGFRHLNESEIELCLERFGTPEKFFFEDGELCVLQFKPNTKSEDFTSTVCSIWKGKYDPRNWSVINDEIHQKLQSLNRKAQNELMCSLPESCHNSFEEFLSSTIALREHLEQKAFEAGVRFGKTMYYPTQ